MPPPNLAARNCFFVNYVGTDDAGYDAIGHPWSYLTVAGALAAIAAVPNPPSSSNPWTIAVGPGIFNEVGFELPPWVWITGSADNESPEATQINLSSDFTMHPSWSNGAARGGMSNLIIRAASGDPKIDMTMPAPASGNPARVVSLIGITFDRSFIWQATGSGDVLNWKDLINDGVASGHSLAITGGTVNLDDATTLIPVAFSDSTAEGLTGSIKGLVIADTAGATVAAAHNAVSLEISASHLGEITATQSGSGTLTILADAVSIPLIGSVTEVGAVTLTRTSDANGEGYTPAVPANWPSLPATVQQALDELAANSGGGGGGFPPGTNLASVASGASHTVTPTARIWTQVIDYTAGAGANLVILDITGAVAGQTICLQLNIILNNGSDTFVRNATSGGTILARFDDGNVSSARFDFVFGTVATGYPSSAWYPISYLVPATT